MNIDSLKSIEKLNYRLRGADAEVISIDLLEKRIKEMNDADYDLPLLVMRDTVSSGSLFHPVREECLVLTNKNHTQDYFSYCALIRKQGKMATVSFFYYGSSKLTGRMNASKNGEHPIKGLLAGALLNKNAYEEEYEYYDMLDQLCSELFE